MLNSLHATTNDFKQLQTRLKGAKLRQSACVEDVDLKVPRGLDKSLWTNLVSLNWLLVHQNISITGKTGSGKSFLACALGQKACREGYTCLYSRASRLFHDLSIAKGTGTYAKLLDSISKRDLLVIDDFGLAALTDEQRRDLLEIMDDRYQKRSTVIVSQLPTAHWYELIGEPTIADAILDRFVHNSHKIDLKGKSIRENNGIDKN